MQINLQGDSQKIINWHFLSKKSFFALIIDYNFNFFIFWQVFQIFMNHYPVHTLCVLSIQAEILSLSFQKWVKLEKIVNFWKNWNFGKIWICHQISLKISDFRLLKGLWWRHFRSNLTQKCDFRSNLPQKSVFSLKIRINL